MKFWNKKETEKCRKLREREIRKRKEWERKHPKREIHECSLCGYAALRPKLQRQKAVTNHFSFHSWLVILPFASVWLTKYIFCICFGLLHSSFVSFHSSWLHLDKIMTKLWCLRAFSYERVQVLCECVIFTGFNGTVQDFDSLRKRFFDFLFVMQGVIFSEAPRFEHHANAWKVFTFRTLFILPKWRLGEC